MMNISYSQGADQGGCHPTDDRSSHEPVCRRHLRRSRLSGDGQAQSRDGRLVHHDGARGIQFVGE